jgi:hypothetical protein
MRYRRVRMTSAPGVRRFTNNTPEPPGKMRLIAHPAAHGDLAEGLAGAQHERLGGPDP